MIVDTSALMAILLEEPEGPAFARAIAEAAQVGLSSANHLELTIVTARRKSARAIEDAEALIEQLAIEILPVTLEEGRIARDAFLRFGRGIHPAALNYGDCFAYAAAKARGLPLLFKGDDFALTDITPALTR
jgi:ribonuclease VapC